MKEHFKRFFPFALRFTTAHVITYMVCGITFMLAQGYFDVIAADPVKSMIMKPADAFTVRLAIPLQFVRGFLFALALYPFRSVMLENPKGWLKLASLMLLLTSINAVAPGPGTIEGFIYTYFSFRTPWVGYPEIICQAFLFSFVSCAWFRSYQRKMERRSRSHECRRTFTGTQEG